MRVLARTSGAIVSRTSPTNLPLAKTRMRWQMAISSGRSEEMNSTPVPPRRASTGGRRSPPARRRRCRASARRKGAPSSRGTAIWRSPPSAGCRPRNCARVWSIDGVLIRRSATRRVAALPLRVALEDAVVRDLCKIGDGDVLGAGHAEQEALPLAVLGHQAEPVPHRVARRLDRHALAFDIDVPGDLSGRRRKSPAPSRSGRCRPGPRRRRSRPCRRAKDTSGLRASRLRPVDPQRLAA